MVAACSKPPQHAQWLAASANGDVAAAVARQRAESARSGRSALVYVGASWCEPCTRFHDAAARGALDAVFGDVDVLAFDADRDRARLDAAGYTSQLIPLLAVPNVDGTASAQRMEGSIKGEGAVAEMTPRLRALLGR